MLVYTSLCAELSEIMAAAVGSPVGVRSKVKVPEVVNCPEGDTVTVEGQQTFKKMEIKGWQDGKRAHMWFLEPV